MKISELRLYLDSIFDEHGDIEVVVSDADTGLLLGLDPIDIDTCSAGGVKRVEIRPDYGTVVTTNHRGN